MQIKGTSVIAFVFRKQKDGVLFLMMKRSKERGGFWQSVSGGIKDRETAVQAALREVDEETGLPVKRYWTVHAINSFYKEDEDTLYLEPCFGVEAGESKVKLTDEHAMFRWCTAEEAIRLLPFDPNKSALRALCLTLGLKIPHLETLVEPPAGDPDTKPHP